MVFAIPYFFEVIMIFKDAHSRVILWGVKLHEDYLVAELAYWGAGLGNNRVAIQSGKHRITVELPDNCLNQFQPTKSQNVTLEIV